MLPVEFIHTPPEGYHYEVQKFGSTNMDSIWIVHERSYVYTDQPVRCIWGFFDKGKRRFYSPINSKRKGNQVDIKLTTPYSAMLTNMTPLERAFYD